MSLFTHFATEHAQTQLADIYSMLGKIPGEPLVEEARKKILAAYEDLQKVSEAIGQQLEERR